MIKGPKKTVSLILPQEDYDRLKALADDTCRTIPSYIRMMIYHYLHRLARSDTRQNDWWVVK